MAGDGRARRYALTAAQRVDLVACARVSEAATSESNPRADRLARPPRAGRRHPVVEWLVVIIVALAAAFLIKTYVVESYVVPTASMYPTIKDGDRVLVNKLSFDFGHTVHAGDIIVFHESPNDTDPSTPVLIKRVIGLPGQTLRSGPHGQVFVDGKRLDEPWLNASALDAGAGPAICSTADGAAVPAATADCHDGVLQLPAGQYYVMGDHRGDSSDSRFWGPIPRRLIIGRAFVRIWPLNRLHWW
jgi:signal peptidase I